MLGVGLIALVGLVGANAFFVLSEFALITVDRGRLEQRAEAGDPRARALLNASMARKVGGLMWCSMPSTS